MLLFFLSVIPIPTFVFESLLKIVCFKFAKIKTSSQNCIWIRFLIKFDNHISNSKNEFFSRSSTEVWLKFLRMKTKKLLYYAFTLKDVLILAQFRLLDEDKITIKNGVLPRELGLLAKRLLEKESIIFTVQPWTKVIFIWDITKIKKNRRSYRLFKRFLNKIITNTLWRSTFESFFLFFKSPQNLLKKMQD